MARKTKQQKGDAAAPQSTATTTTTSSRSKAKQADSQLWSALKHEDAEELLELLFDQIEDAESGELRHVQKPTARKAMAQPNAKKIFPLSYAVAEGLSQSIVELLLRAGAAVNKKDESAEQSTALHGACWNEDGEVAALLLRAGADPRVVDADGRTPLHVLATSNATNLLLSILDSVGHTTSASKEEDGGDDEKRRGAAPFAISTSAAVRVDALQLLAMADKSQGATVLHLALGESTYNFGVAQVLCDYLEKSGFDEAAVAQLVSSGTRPAGDSPLHVLVSTANAEDAVVEALVRRLLALGADPLARNAALQSVTEVAVAARPGCSSKAGVQLYETLLSAAFAKDNAGHFLCDKNSNGHALIHVAVAAGNTSAVKALCAAVPVNRAAALLGDPCTADGISVVELLATTAGSVEMANALIIADAVARDAYASLRQSHAAVQAEHQKAAATAPADVKEREEDNEEEGSDVEGEDEAAAANAGASASSALANLKRRQGGNACAAGGLSRAQQARRARAATAAQRKQQSSGQHHGSGADGERGGLFGHGGGQLSTPVKVMGVLLLLSLFVSAYTAIFGMGDGAAESA